MDKPTSLLLFGLLWIATAMGQTTHASSSRPMASTKNHNPKIKYGTASFYANKFDGRRTANGEVFRQDKMTGASNRIDLNTWVEVTNLRNKKSTIVKITDRMDVHNKRLIDLSRSAASRLGYTAYGLARVKVEILGKRKPLDGRIRPE